MKREVSLLDRGKIREAAGVLGRAFRDDPIVVAILEDVAPEINTLFCGLRIVGRWYRLN
jgi:hypothetical protein